jgi:hypothetical protein
MVSHGALVHQTRLNPVSIAHRSAASARQLHVVKGLPCERAIFFGPRKYIDLGRNQATPGCVFISVYPTSEALNGLFVCYEPGLMI